MGADTWDGAYSHAGTHNYANANADLDTYAASHPYVDTFSSSFFYAVTSPYAVTTNPYADSVPYSAGGPFR